jgi:predicted transposase/invertase (TIGR01784 family)
MAHYLDPKNDLVFKKIFGEHPHLLVSFLNALMPLGPDQQIESVEYLPAELVPDTPAKKNSIVDVRCKDNKGRHFIVEMQMVWTMEFFNRLVFNVSKAFVRQLKKGNDYDMLQPVYGLGILEQDFDHKTEEFYHHFQTINRNNTNEVIKGLEFVLIELNKFKPTKIADRKMAVLWLRFLKEMEDETRHIDQELLANDIIRQAAEICEEGGFTEAELYAYDKYWDNVRVEHALIRSSRAEGLTKGLAEGKAIGKEEGKQEAKIEMIESCFKAGYPLEDIAKITGLTPEEVNAILDANG